MRAIVRVMELLRLTAVALMHCARAHASPNTTGFFAPRRARGDIMINHVAGPKSLLIQNKSGKYIAVALLFALSACAAGSPDATQAAQSGGLSVFVLGFWHGLIAPVTLLIAAIKEFATDALPWSARMYQEGGGVIYDLGFFIGIIAGPSILWTGSLRRR